MRPWWIDLTPHLVPGKTAELRYEPHPYDFADASADDRPKQGEIDAASHVVRSYLVLYRTPGALMAAPSLQVTGVVDGSEAAGAGVKAGDYIARYDGHDLASVDDLRAAIRSATEAGNERVTAVVYRGSERMELEVRPGRMGVNLATR